MSGTSRDAILRSAFRVLIRRERGMQEHCANTSVAVRDSPDPASVSADTCERYLAVISHLIGDYSADRRFAATAAALMIGFGESVRTLGLFDTLTFDEPIEHYVAFIQAKIDVCASATWAVHSKTKFRGRPRIMSYGTSQGPLLLGAGVHGPKISWPRMAALLDSANALPRAG
ncbi:hypothetical protein AB4Y87_24920 [Paenarthrobacter sp. RAF54_2]|uniref:hypothetical protein n=1 Tax=Paenarthrobacter sp. RAF54_2 TaxID=3233061 RepID=UPI003F94D41C